MNQNRPMITYILIGICVLVFFLEPKNQSFEVDASNDFNRLFAFIPSLAFSYPWSFVTSIFMHASLYHLLVNMFVFLIFGNYLERRISPRKFLLIFLITGIAGNFGYMISTYTLQKTFLGSLYNPNTLGLGASGAIYGVLGALAVLEPYSVVYVYFIPMPMIVAVGFWTLLETVGFFVPAGIARGAHLGGLFFGLLIGYFLRKEIQRTRVIHVSSF